tara:strand:+ start:1898 stop:2995 length:1098 start_codon:yes stop_codon:yes gene_type:complete
MKFAINRDAFLGPLQLVSSVVERRQTIPVLSNLLVVAGEDGLSLTGTDQEVELSARVTHVEVSEPGDVTVPARKLVDICRSLPADAEVTVEQSKDKIHLRCGRFKSQLATLPVGDFPKVPAEESEQVSVTIGAEQLKQCLAKTSFAMAQQDVRYFFNGLLIDLGEGGLTAVATNGQRLAVTTSDGPGSLAPAQFIVPRKAVGELSRMVSDGDIRLGFSTNHVSVESGSSTLVSKLIDGTFPDYRRAIPEAADKLVTCNRHELREALSRTSILSNEMYRNVRLQLATGEIRISANNPMQEEAEEVVSVEYEGPELEIGFNVSYLLDALSALAGDVATLAFLDANTATVIRDPEDEASVFVVSPMML